MTFIIIEGPTCAGKSTLQAEIAHQIEATTGATPAILHQGQPAERTRRWVLDAYANKIDRWFVAGKSQVIADRWAWGEPVYAPIYRPETNVDGFGLLGIAGWRWVELFLMSRGAITVHVTASADTLVERLRARGDDHVKTVGDLLSIASRYKDIVPFSPTYVMRVDTTDVSLAAFKRTAKIIVNIATVFSEGAARMARWPGYIGSPRPQLLLLGDTRNLGASNEYLDETRLPFMPVPGGSGEYLLSALPEWAWRRCGIVNANDPGMTPHELHALWVALERPRVVALGMNALRAGEAASIDSERLHSDWHPQYARRFHYADREKYGLRIAGPTSSHH